MLDQPHSSYDSMVKSAAKMVNNKFIECALSHKLTYREQGTGSNRDLLVTSTKHVIRHFTQQASFGNKEADILTDILYGGFSTMWEKELEEKLMMEYGLSYDLADVAETGQGDTDVARKGDIAKLLSIKKCEITKHIRREIRKKFPEANIQIKRNTRTYFPPIHFGK